MKKQFLKSVKREAAVHGLNYRWTSQGIHCSGRTAARGRDVAQAERRLFKQGKGMEVAL